MHLIDLFDSFKRMRTENKLNIKVIKREKKGSKSVSSGLKQSVPANSDRLSGHPILGASRLTQQN